MYQSLTPLTNIQSLRDPYSFFVTVVSQASRPDGNLPGYNLGCPDKSAELIIQKNDEKIVCNLNISD